MTGIVDADAEGALDFLMHWAPGGPWVLSAIEPDGPIQTLTFHHRQAAKNWIERWQGKRNIYFSVNTPKSDLENPKPTSANSMRFKSIWILPMALTLNKLRRLSSCPASKTIGLPHR